MAVAVAETARVELVDLEHVVAPMVIATASAAAITIVLGRSRRGPRLIRLLAVKAFYQLFTRRRRARTTLAQPTPARSSAPANKPCEWFPPLVLPSPVRTAPFGTCVTWLPAVQVGLVMVFACNVTAPLRANARP